MSKPSTPVRRSKVGPGRPGSAGSEIPDTASMEVLTPDPSVPAHKASELGRSQDLYVAPIGSKPRTPGSAALIRTRSQDGRRSALAGSHEVIPLTSTTSKSIPAHPLALQVPGGASPAVSIIAQASAALPPQSPYAGGLAQGGMTPTGASLRARAQPQADVAISTASSRFNPVVEDDDMMPPLPAHQPQEPLAGASSGARESQVVVGGSASAVAMRAASAAASAGRRYAAADSVALSLEAEGQLRPQSGERSGTAGETRGADDSVPGTPGSVASGRVGGVFFTDLHRSFGGTPRGRGVNDSQDLGGTMAIGEEEGEEDGDGRQRASRQTRFSTVTSRLNPMQSPTSSEDGDEDDDFAEYAGNAVTRSEAETGPGAADDAETASDRRTSMSALTDYVNPVQTPYDSRLATPLLTTTGEASERPATAASTESRQSLLLMIRDLYVTEPSQQPSVTESSRPATAASEAAAAPTPAAQQQPAEAAGGEEGDAAVDESDALAASRAAVAALAARTDSEQLRRRSELGDYMTTLQDLKDDSGGKLVELPADWGVMLERLFRQRRAEFATLEGWMGPHRFEDLPISQLPSDHPDPRVEEGLARIRELDAVLNDKLIAALISHRETFPEQWAEQERKRLDKHTKAVEEALKRERQKRLRAARISRAVTALDGPEGLAEEESAGSMAQGSARALAGQPSVYSRMYTLRPEEEALVEAVMKRNDEEGAAINPFDLESAATYGGGGVGVTETGEAAGDGPAGEWADADDIDLELDMFLPSASASACATPSAAPKVMRPLSARLTEADGGAGTGLRPLSAASYSSSRPGTSSGLIGGMSPIAAAALHGHPALLAAGAGLAGNPRASATGGGGGGLLPERVYEDPRAAARALRAINARLAAFESEHLWDESGALADFKSVVATQQSPQQQQQGRQPGQSPGAEASAGPGLGSAPSVGPGSQASPPAAGPGARASSPPRSVKSAAGGPAPSVGGVSVTAGGQRDYLREERVAKEIANRERDVDAALRSLKTSEVVKLGEATLKALVEQCRRLQELNEHRRKIEKAEAAARKAQLQRQQLMSRGSDAGSGRGTPRGGSASSASGRGSNPAQPPAAAITPTAGRAAASTGGTSPPATVEGGAPASSGRGSRPAAAAGSAGPGLPAGAAASAGGGGGGGSGLRQSSAGKSRTGAGGATPTGSSQSAARRASDPATGSAGAGGAAAGPPASPGPGSSGSNSSSSRAGKASAGGNASAGASGGAVTAKPRAAGKTAGLATSLDGGGLPPPPPPPPP